MQLKTTLRTQTKVTAHMMLTTRLLRLSGAEVEEVVKQELAENPALEGEERHRLRSAEMRPAASRSMDRDSSTGLGHWAVDTDDPIERLAARESPIDRLLGQARLMVPTEDVETVSYLIQSLDERGFLTASEEELAPELGVSKERLRQAIAWLHQLDPPGIGARNLRECFLLQCADLQARGTDCKTVVYVLEKAWDPFARQRWNAVARCVRLSRSDIDAVLCFIREKLYPHPLQLVPQTAEEDSVLTRPDLIVRRSLEGGAAKFQVEIPAAQPYELRISPVFRMVLNAADQTGLGPEARAWTGEAIERARMFLAALEQRQRTLRRIGEFLACYQSAFFEHGPRSLRSLTRAELARQLGVHESTISRAVSDKVLQLPDGRLVALSDLFDRSLAAKEAIRAVLAQAGEPISDREIAARLERDSLHLARRTVAKYRSELHIPAAGRRRDPSQYSVA